MAANDNRHEARKALAAVQEHVLPGLGDAWDEADPVTVLVAAGVLGELWRESGYSPADLLAMVAAFDPDPEPVLN
jgi:hypothetical protein